MLWCSRQQNSKMDRFPERIRRAVLMPAPLPPPSPPIPLLGFPLPLPPPPPLAKFQHLIMTRENAPYAGRDVFSTLIGHEVDFWRFTGETVASFMDVVQGVRPIFDANTASTGSKHKLGVENRLLMTYYWIKKYPDLVEMGVMFELSDKSISRDLHLTVDILWQYFQGCIRWPTDEEWIQMCGYWENIPDAVGAIDGTVHIIQMPEEDGHLYFSGLAHQYCISTQVICDNKGHIRHLHVSSMYKIFVLPITQSSLPIVHAAQALFSCWWCSTPSPPSNMHHPLHDAMRRTVYKKLRSTDNSNAGYKFINSYIFAL